MILEKGQSTIEYLATYGWMLLIIAIVGGAIFSTLQNTSNIKSISGFSGDNMKLENFGITEGNLKAEIRASSAKNIENIQISITNPQTMEKITSDGNSSIPVADTEVVSVKGLEKSNTTNTLDMAIKYDMGNLENLESEGKLRGKFEINSAESEGGSSSIPSAPTNIKVGSSPTAPTKIQINP